MRPPSKKNKMMSRMRNSCSAFMPRNTGWLLFLLTTTTLLGSARGDWVDPDTPESFRTTKALSSDDQRDYELVFSDEFEVEGRTFHDGSDPRWTALNKNDYTNFAEHFYSHDNARTINGVLNITTEQKLTDYRAFDEDKEMYYHGQKSVKSAMLQGWNKFCFIGGIVEFSAKLPGDPNVGGLWPALWMLGNLARATYVGSSDNVWPFSYNKCNARHREGQHINACAKRNHYGLKSYQGRGSPEIDIIEAMQGAPGHLSSTKIQRPYQSTSLQVAPGIEGDRPVLGSRPVSGHWYNGLEYGNHSDLNPFFYGSLFTHKQEGTNYQADALSANLQLNNSFYEKQHIYRVEWEPPAENGTGGYVKWFTDNELVYGIYGESLRLMETEIPSEPMYMIMNTAVATHWGFPPCPDYCSCECYICGNPKCECALGPNYCSNFPASFEIDYVRVYQSKTEPKHGLGCSPPDRPTAQYIKGNPRKYMDETDVGNQPLWPVRRGGAPCSSDDDCGGKARGKCSGYGRHKTCSCAVNTTGPTCLAHMGTYSAKYLPKATPFSVFNISFPLSFLVALGLLGAAFVLFWHGAVRSKQTGDPAEYHPILGRDQNSAQKPGLEMNYQATQF